jgi:hypothetical protein
LVVSCNLICVLKFILYFVTWCYSVCNFCVYIVLSVCACVYILCVL